MINGRMPSYIFDIDGTIADLTHRLHHITEKKPKDWDSFFEGIYDDKPILHILPIIRAVHAQGFKVVLVSGRNDEYRVATVRWLENKARIPYHALYMRKKGDRRDDQIVKLGLLEYLRLDGYEPVMAFDDRTRVVEMWRAQGIPCAQVAKGDF